MAKHEYYAVQGKTLGNIAETMKTVLGVDKDTPIRFDEITNNEKAEQVTENVDAQAEVIEQIKAALNGKSSIGVKEIMDIIDQSGVLGTTDGTATEKVEQLIEKAEIYKFLMYESRLIRFNANQNVVETPILDCININSMHESFDAMNNLKTVHLRNTQTVKNWGATFYGDRNLETVETLDFSSATQISNPFMSCFSLVNIKIVEETIKLSISFATSPLLSDESIQSIIDGLATVETAQTLTLHKDVKAKLTEEQLATITNKNWNLA